MKPRIKIDGSLVAVAIVLTGIFFLSPKWYPVDILYDDLCDVFGILCILKGTLLRMSARAHKLAHSNQSASLVTTGPYSIIRNPMYLGSFLIGAGFVFLLWPWRMIFVFALVFYIRFIKQINAEEKFLTENFEKEYGAYCEGVPQLFPKLEALLMINPKSMFNLEEIFKTKEARNLYTWLPAAFIFEVIQENFIYKDADILKTIIIFVLTILFFGAAFILFYRLRDDG